MEEDVARSPSSQRWPSEGVQTPSQSADDDELSPQVPVRSAVSREIWPVSYATFNATTTSYPLPPSVKVPEVTSTTEVVSQSLLNLASPSSSGSGLAFGISEDQSTSLISPKSEPYDRFLLPSQDGPAKGHRNPSTLSSPTHERRIVPPSSLSWLVSHFISLGRPEGQTALPGTGSNSTPDQSAPNPFASTLARDALLAYAHRIFKYPFQPIPLVAPILSMTAKHVPTSSPAHPYSKQLLPLLRGMKKLHPRHLPTLLLLGCVLYAVGDYEASVAQNNDILAIDSGFVEAISNIGTNFQALGRLQDAEYWWWKAIRLRPSFWDAVYNIISAQFSTHSDTSGSTSRARDTLKLCEYVQSEIVGEGGELKCSIPPLDFPRLQNIFCISGSLRSSFDLSSGVECVRDYATSVGILLSREGQGGLSIRHLILAACVSGLHLCEALPQSICDLAAGLGYSLSALGQKNGNDLDMISFIKTSERDLLSLLCGSARLVPAIFLSPEQASRMMSLIFAPSRGVFPALCERNQLDGGLMVPTVDLKNESSRIASFALLGMAKKLQEDSFSSNRDTLIDGTFRSSPSLTLILYYVAHSISPTPSTCNNAGILLSSTPWTTSVISGNGFDTGKLAQRLARAFYEDGLRMDDQNSHILVNMGSLVKESGNTDEAVQLYVRAIQAKPDFDVALTNLANAMKDMGRIAESIPYYRRAIEANRTSPLAEATCGLTHALVAVCDWRGFGHINATQTIDHSGHLKQRSSPLPLDNWSTRLATIVTEQLLLSCRLNHGLVESIGTLEEWMMWIQNAVGVGLHPAETQRCSAMLNQYFSVDSNLVAKNEGGFVLQMIEWLSKALQWRWYADAYDRTSRATSVMEPLYKHITAEQANKYRRPQIPPTMSVQSAVSILPFHTFIYPLAAKSIRLIAYRSALRLSHTTLASHWLPEHVFPPPAPPFRLNIGYISSDYTDHPTAHLMQSVFGFHDRERFHIFTYAITASDGSIYRQKITADTETFRDVCTWSTQEIVEQVIRDEIHILVNLNGYTKNARNDIFAARPCPIQMSLLGFAGTLSAGWCDYLICDPIVCPPEMRKCQYCGITGVEERESQLDFGGDFEGSDDSWIYSEKLLYMPHSYLVTDHRYSFGDLGFGSSMNEADFEQNWAKWEWERDHIRLLLFPEITRDTIVFANFNQIDPQTFMTWLKILKRVPKSILWLLRFPAEGEQHLLRTARDWASPEIAERLRFTDVVSKTEYIRRAFAADLFLDTTECNAHTTAADVLWAGVPMITWSKHTHKMCSRVGASAAYATGFGDQMVVDNLENYEERAVALAAENISCFELSGVLSELDLLRRNLCQARNEMPLFDTRRWTKNLEQGFEKAWETWVRGGGVLHFKTEASEQQYNCNGYIWLRDEG